MTLSLFALLLGCAEAPERAPVLAVVFDASGSRRAPSGDLRESASLTRIWDAYTATRGVRAGMGLTVEVVGEHLGGDALVDVPAPDRWVHGQGNVAAAKVAYRDTVRATLAQVRVANGSSAVLTTLSGTAQRLVSTKSNDATLVIVSDLFDASYGRPGWYLRADDPAEALIATSRAQAPLPPLVGVDVVVCGVYAPDHVERKVGVPAAGYFARASAAFEEYLTACGARSVHILQACDLLSLKAAFAARPEAE